MVATSRRALWWPSIGDPALGTARTAAGTSAERALFGRGPRIIACMAALLEGWRPL